MDHLKSKDKVRGTEILGPESVVRSGSSPESSKGNQQGTVGSKDGTVLVWRRIHSIGHQPSSERRRERRNDLGKGKDELGDW